MFSTDFIFRQQENLVDNQKCQAGFRPLYNKILFPEFMFIASTNALEPSFFSEPEMPKRKKYVLWFAYII